MVVKVNDSTYSSIHHWLKRHYGKANRCDVDGCRGDSQTYSWALKHGCEYEHNRDNFLMMCASCHKIYDTNGDVWNKGKKMSEEYREKCRQSAKKRAERQHKPILQISMDGKIVGCYKSVGDALETLGKSNGHISDVLTGKKKTACGFYWDYDYRGLETRKRELRALIKGKESILNDMQECPAREYHNTKIAELQKELEGLG